MKVNFADIEEVMNEGFKGGDGVVGIKGHDWENGRFLQGRVTPHSSIGQHVHDSNNEIMYIVKGTATFIYDGVEEIVHEGECHYCPKDHGHTLINNTDEDVVFFAVLHN